MGIIRRLLALIGGVLALTAAALLLIHTGLPQRAAYTGLVVPGEAPIAPEIGAVAPPFELLSADGERVRLTDLRGSPVILNFWGTWCEPCRVEMPVLQTLYDDHRPDDLRVLAVNLGESPPRVRDWRRALGLTYEMLIDERQTVAALYALRGQPSTYVIAPDGIITHIFYGPASADALQAALGLPDER